MWKTICSALRRETQRKLDRAIDRLPAMEQLENRSLLTVTFDSATGTLGIDGTAGDNFFEIQKTSSTEFVVRTSPGSAGKTYDLAPVKRVVAHLGDGSDTLQTVAYPGVSLFDKPMHVYGDEFGGGRDTIITGAGADYVEGGSGNDSIKTGAGNDVTYGYVKSYLDNPDDADCIDAGTGNDEVHGGPDKDIIHGRLGQDTLYGDASDDIIYGDEDNDTIFGNDGGDELYGLAGNDEIDGGAGINTLCGGEGEDTLCGGDEADSIHGGDNDDYIWGFGGIDTVFAGTGNDHADGGSGDDSIFGDTGDDSLDGGDGSDSINGGAGNDTLHGGSGDFDALYGGTGNDRIWGEAGENRLYGEEGDDDLYGGPDYDVIFGGSGRDGLFGGDHEDVLDGGPDSDRFLDYYDPDGIFFISNWQDTHSDFTDSEDARIGFMNGTHDEDVTDSGGHTTTYGPKDWTDDEIETADVALCALHDATGNDELLEQRHNNKLVFVRQAGPTGGDYGWNNGSRIYITNVGAGSAEDLHSTIIHEIGHHWDEEWKDWGDWKDLSGWRTTNPYDSVNYTEVDAGGWWYLSDREFVHDYCRDQPVEDYATTFEFYFMNLGGLYDPWADSKNPDNQGFEHTINDDAVKQKKEFFDTFVADLQAGLGGFLWF